MTTIPTAGSLAALKRAQMLVLGRSAAVRQANLAELRRSGTTDAGVRGFGLGPKLVNRVSTGAIAVRFHVASKLSVDDLEESGTSALPLTLAGMATDVVAVPFSSSVAAPGASIKHAVGSTLGSLACILDLGGQLWALSASHVVAPSDVSPQCGDDVWIGSEPRAKLHAWTPVAPFASVHVDAALASTVLAATTHWPDGKTFAGKRAYDPQNGPFTFYGAISGAQSGSGEAILGSSLGIDVPGVGLVLYAAQALVAAGPVAGDSGAAVRDAAGYLVGLVVGATDDGRACITPWQSLGPVLDSLAAG